MYVLVVVQIVDDDEEPVNLSGYELEDLIDATVRYGSERRRRQAMNVYIAANLTEAQLADGFTLGDGGDYGGYTNHKLDPGVRYNVGLWSQVDGTSIPILNQATRLICKSVWLESMLQVSSLSLSLSLQPSPRPRPLPPPPPPPPLRSRLPLSPSYQSWLVRGRLEWLSLRYASLPSSAVAVDVALGRWIS